MPPRHTPEPTPASTQSRPIIPHQPETRVRVTLELSASLFDLYEEQAIAAGNPSVEDYLVQRLQSCREHNSQKSLYLNADQCRRLESALEHNFSNPEVAIAQITAALAIQVEDVGVQLSPQLARRIASRVFKGETYAGVIQREVTRGLEIFAGMRPA